MKRLLLPIVPLLAAPMIAGCGSGPDAASGGATGNDSPPQAQHERHSTDSSPHKTYKEISDYRGGVTVYEDRNFTASDAGSIPFRTSVRVSCFWKNDSGQYASINGLYHVVAPEQWAGEWAIANQFANGQPLGKTTSEGQRDPKVPDC